MTAELSLDPAVLPAGTALAATGSLARGELTEFSDLDLLLIHPAGRPPSPVEADRVWQAARASGRRVDFAVRDPGENGAIVAAEPTAALALLDLRHLAGAEDLTARSRRRVLDAWRRGLPRCFDAVVESAIARWRRSGSVVAMTRPNLKNGRGGLRDHEFLRALGLSQLTSVPGLAEERGLLLAVRARLHHHAHRHLDVCTPEFAEDIAAELGYPDRFGLAREVVAAGTAIDRELAAALNRARDLLATPAVHPAPRRPLDVDVLADRGRVVLSRRADLGDPGLALRVAAASARSGLAVHPDTWRRLRGLPELPERWPASVTEDFLAALSSPRRTAENILALDECGLWERYVPQWPGIRGRMPNEPNHVHTVDRHTLEVLAGCARGTLTVARPDLLLLAGLFHDVGKTGHRTRPHAAIGAEAVARFAATLDFPLRDRSCLQVVVAEHGLIAQLAASMDPTSPEALTRLLDAAGHDLLTIELLAALVEADARGTGPGVWSAHLRLTRDVLLAGARRELGRFRPMVPAVHAPEGIALRPAGSGGESRQVISWRGPVERLPRLVRACHHHAVLVQAARCRVSLGTAEVELEARPTTHGGLDVGRLNQAVLSAEELAAPAPGPGPAAVIWSGRYLEVRTRDRPGVLDALFDLLPEFDWLDAQTVGASVIARVALGSRPGPEARAAIDQDVARALGAGM